MLVRQHGGLSILTMSALSPVMEADSARNESVNKRETLALLNPGEDH